MKAILFIAILFSASFSQAEETAALNWHTDLDKAHSESTISKKPIFGFFTGSDWCGWCIKLQREVFAKPAFIEWANANVVLLELDFPKRKELSTEQRTQNQNLQRAFNITGYPTVWLFTSKKDANTGGFNLTRLGKLSYPSGAIKGKEEVKFLENANVILSKYKAS